MIVVFCFIALPSYAQIGIQLQVNVEESLVQVFLGSANMDSDANEELVFGYHDYFDTSFNQPRLSRLLIIDGVTGEIDWNSGDDWSRLYIAGFNAQESAGQSPFCDVNQDGIMEITFVGHQNSGEDYHIFVVGITSGTRIESSDDNFAAQAQRLSQNYPNPFNPTTSIDFVLDKKTHVTIEIYNAAGQKLKTLVDEQREPGDYSVNWNGDTESGKKAASGVYFYQLQIDDQKPETKKMLLLK